MDLNNNIIATYKVFELTRLIQRTLAHNFGYIAVIGEISNLKIPKTGHIYFTIKDEYSQIKAVKFRGIYDASFKKLKDGDKIKAFGNLTVYEKGGYYEINVDRIEKLGIGDLQKRYFELLEKLRKEGLFEKKFKKEIPMLPKKIAIVTSPTGAAIRDMLNVLERRFGNIHIIVYPVKVQGEGAADEIADAINNLNIMGEVDVIIVGRGGGSLEDLWAFNEEVVARAIFKSKIPIISAVGHQTDYTISDHVADLRAETPTAAAEMVLKNKKEFIDLINAYGYRLENYIERKIESYKARLKWCTDHYAFKSPQNILQQYIQRVDECYMKIKARIEKIISYHKDNVGRLREKMNLLNPEKFIGEYKRRIRESGLKISHRILSVISNCRHKVQKEKEKLDTLNPYGILSRGYSITRCAKSGKIIKYAREAEKELETILYKGKIISILKNKED